MAQNGSVPPLAANILHFIEYFAAAQKNQILRTH